jgi:(2Fe-2S) ferredoxin
MNPRRMKIIVCRGPECGERLGSAELYAAFHDAVRQRGLEGRAELGWQSCFGRCRQGCNVLVRPVMPGEGRLLVAAPPIAGPGAAFYSGVTRDDVATIVDEHVVGGRVVRALVRRPGEGGSGQ